MKISPNRTLVIILCIYGKVVMRRNHLLQLTRIIIYQKRYERPLNPKCIPPIVHAPTGILGAEGD